MAFRTQFNPEGRRPAILFNIDRSVGFIGSNLTVDVKLVQALFRIFYYDLLGKNGGFAHPPQDPNPPKIDGVIGPVTRRLIVAFQQTQFRKAGGIANARDGSFDPFRGNREQSKINPVFYSLETLNLRLSNLLLSLGFGELSDILPVQSFVTEQPDLVIAITGPLRTTAQQYIDGIR
jgi:hypothetical protein